MGLSASQARFLQLTARKNDIEYQTQQITQERLSLAQQLTQVSNEYNDAISNKKLVFSYADSTVHQIDVNYTNYKNFMNQQDEKLQSSQKQVFLVSTSGKIVVNSVEDMEDMIEKNTEYIKKDSVEGSGTDYSALGYNLVQRKIDENSENSPFAEYYAKQKFDESNFVIMTKDEASKEKMLNDKKENIIEGYGDNITEEQMAEAEKYINTLKNKIMTGVDLNDTDAFQKAIREGIFSFATIGNTEDTKNTLVPENWSTAVNGAFTEKLDESDDAAAEAKYDKESKRLELYDKKMQMEMDELESERDAIKTEMDSIKQVVDDNIQKTFDTFS